jgi:hypothetical protein
VLKRVVAGLGWQESAPGEHQQRRRSIWMPCYNETEAERLGVHQVSHFQDHLSHAVLLSLSCAVWVPLCWPWVVQ